MSTHHTILLVGAQATDPAIYTYAPSFAHALRSLGHTVTLFNYRGTPTPWRYLNTLIINHNLVRIAKKIRPSIIFLLKAETISPATLRTVKKINPNVKVISFYPDNPFTFWNGNSNSNVLMSLPLIDCFLSWSPDLVPILKTAGCKHVCPFPFAYDHELFNQEITISLEEQKKYASDACFIGTWEPDRELWLTKLVECLPSINLAIWGNLWAERCTNSALKTFLKGSAIYGVEMIKAFRCATVVLNFIRQQNALGHNMRTFEVPASKAFLLTQWTHEQAHILFEENRHIATFKNIDELVDKILRYNSHSQERENLLKMSYNHVQQYSLQRQLQMYFNTCSIHKGDNFTCNHTIVKQSSPMQNSITSEKI